jgi:Hemerythrin HHE cation binding domain
MEDALALLRHEHDQLGEQFQRVSDPDADRVETLGRLVQRLAAHISAEQSLLLPVLKKNRIGGRKLLRRLRSDYHRMGRCLVLIERRKGNSPDLPPLVTRLHHAYHAHARRFELAVYPGLRARASANDLQDLMERIESAEAVILSHPHPHLLSLGPLSRLTTRMAAIFDRARDKTPPVSGLRQQHD